MIMNTITPVVESNQVAKRTLDAICGSGRFPHALMIEGEKGVYSDAFGIYAAMKALCSAENKPCMLCNHCKKVLKEIHPDVIICGEDGEKSYSIDEVRETRSKAFIIPNEAEKTVFLFKNADTMPEKSQNALLKIIEEPPSHTVFVFLCENTSRMLETILSRVTIIKLDKPSPNGALKIIKSILTDTNDEEILKVLKLTSNNISSTIQILNGENSIFQYAKDLFDSICNGNSYKSLSLLSIITKSKQTKEVMLELKHLLISEVSQHIKQDYSIFSLTPLQAIEITDIIDKVIFMAEQNVNPSILSCYILSKFNLAINEN
ncbi:MAG: hypothetical protein RSD67_06390 [Oscillospiraceae bacterium]